MANEFKAGDFINLKEFPSNSYKSKEKENDDKTVNEEKKKIEKVVVGQVKTRKKSGLGNMIGNFVSEDAHHIKSYLFKDIVIPTVKKTISEVVDMVLFGKSKRSGSNMPRVSYRSFYDEPRNRYNEESRVSSVYNYDDIILESRGEAEEVLSQMIEILDTYDNVSVADLYDLVGLTGKFTDNRYGWTNLRTAEVVRVREGYMLKLPRPTPIK